jgi:hypothetical protein
MEETKKKIQKMIEKKTELIEKNSAIVLSVCSAPNWDADEWAHRQEIMDAFKSKGYQVSTKSLFGVLDITITKSLDLSLNSDFWDCECKDNYLHPKSETTCNECGALAIDQPDSRENEVKTQPIKKDLYENIRNQIRVYVLDCLADRSSFDFRNCEMAGNELAIMQEAENRRSVYSLQEFQDKCNDEEMNLANTFILIR